MRLTGGILALFGGSVELGLGIWAVYYVYHEEFDEGNIGLFFIGLALMIAGFPGIISFLFVLIKKWVVALIFVVLSALPNFAFLLWMLINLEYWTGEYYNNDIMCILPFMVLLIMAGIIAPLFIGLSREAFSKNRRLSKNNNDLSPKPEKMMH
jgi:hypothetical protein